MIWSALFFIGIVQGLFLISLIAYKGSKNLIASRLIIILILIMVLYNLGYIIIRTDLKYYIPQLYGLQWGSLFLFGPLFYFYAKTVIDSSFHWKKKYWLHFLPYFIFQTYNIPTLIIENNDWVDFINIFLAGNLPIIVFAKVMYTAQDLHLFVYLLLAIRWIQAAQSNFGNAQYIISLSSRIKWLKELVFCFSLFFVTTMSLYIFVLINGKYNPVTNYIFTFATSVIIYLIAYKLVLNPELIVPDFNKKYRAYMQFVGEDGDRYLQKLKSIMTESKLYTNPELKLSLLAEQIGLPSHQVSKLINEKCGKSFTDFVNEYRVQAFISRINNADFKSYSIYGIALEVGFNSKSSFNTAFKKITGKNPSDFKASS